LAGAADSAGVSSTVISDIVAFVLPAAPARFPCTPLVDLSFWTGQSATGA
jgi:hypothetical protein